MSSDPADRRQFQRFDLDPPIPGKLGKLDVIIIDVGVLGSMIEHDEAAVVNQIAALVFYTEAGMVELEVEVVYTSSQSWKDPDNPHRGQKGFNSGIRFRQAEGDSDARLRLLIATCARKGIRADQARKQSATAGPPPVSTPDPGDLTLSPFRTRKDTTAVGGFDTYRLDGKSWRKKSTTLPAQPPDGFTVPASEADDHIQLLCRTYESASEDGRKMVRALAEVSVSKVKGLPPKKE